MQSRVQMFLFKARLAAVSEYEAMLGKLGVTGADVTEFLARHPRFASPLHRADHYAGGTAADRLAEIGPLLGKSNLGVRIEEAKRLAGTAVAAAKAAPGWLAKLHKKLVVRGPVLLEQAREEWTAARPVLVENLRQRAKDGFEKGAARFGRKPRAAATETAAVA